MTAIRWRKKTELMDSSEDPMCAAQNKPNQKGNINHIMFISKSVGQGKETNPATPAAHFVAGGLFANVVE